MYTNQSMLVSLPDEILSAIFLKLAPTTLAAVEKTCKRFKDVANDPYIWRSYCLQTWDYWEKHHELEKKLTLPVTTVDWKQLFVERISTDTFVSKTLDSVLASQKDRIAKVESILGKGYDAKDILVHNAQASESVSDVLARRFYSDAILGSFHRKIAVAEWQKLRNGEKVPLERALGAFDMFISNTDTEFIRKRLDGLAAQVLKKHSNFLMMEPQLKALTILSFLRGANLLGINDNTPYAALQNNLISEALFQPNHTSLPLISAAIYCSVAQRLGLEARLCNYPLHIYVRVLISASGTSNSKGISQKSSEDVIYLDPFRSNDEVSVKTLTDELRLVGVPATAHENHIGPAPTRDIVLRSGRNMMNSLRGDPASQQRSTWSRDSLDKESFKYATIWAYLLLEGFAAPNFPYPIAVGQLLQEHFPMDVGLFEEYITPLLSGTPNRDHLAEMTRSMRIADSAPRPVVRRDTPANAHVKYKVGQMMSHKRYFYEGVITGWTPVCKADEQWIIVQGVDCLPSGRQQSFYHVL